MSIVLPPYREPIVQVPNAPPADMPVQWRRWFEEVTREIASLRDLATTQAATLADQAAMLAELETRLEALEP